jgi:carbonic anhydrase/acetyltransferase-like protein (isoleucine patch superfamily)
MGDRIAIRADEGEPFTIGSLARGGADSAGRVNRMGDRVTLHALEHSSIQVGDGVRLGFHVVVHGGEAAGNTPPSLTRIGNGVSVGEFSVVFRSTVGDNVTIGNYAIVDGSQLRPGTAVPDRAIVVNNAIVGSVEW